MILIDISVIPIYTNIEETDTHSQRGCKEVREEVRRFFSRLVEVLEDAPYRHPYFPLGLSIAALLLSIALLITRIMQ